MSDIPPLFCFQHTCKWNKNRKEISQKRDRWLAIMVSNQLEPAFESKVVHERTGMMSPHIAPFLHTLAKTCQTHRWPAWGAPVVTSVYAVRGKNLDDFWKELGGIAICACQKMSRETGYPSLRACLASSSDSHTTLPTDSTLWVGANLLSVYISLQKAMPGFPKALCLGYSFYC